MPIEPVDAYNHPTQHQKNSYTLSPFNAQGLTTRHTEEHEQHPHFVWGLDHIGGDSIYRPL